MSRVFLDDQAVWRGLRADGLVEYEALAGSAFFRAAIERGDIVATERVRDTRLPGDWAAVLRHERVEVISFVYEWPFEMLRDAALLQLSLTRAALRHGFITKDASAYNVQFIGAKPIFIDVGSFERLRASEPWPGYRQFCELFLNPLLIQALRDVLFQPLLRGNVNGIAPGVAAAILGGEGRFNKTVLMHVKLHARAERKYADADRERDVKAELTRAGFGPSVIDAQLKSLEKAVAGLTWTRQGSTWSEYSDRSHYDTSDMQCKERFVAKAVASRSVGQVLDLGANDGHFSRVALRAGARSVVAVDSDDLVIDRLYRDLRREGERRVLPLVIDLADPSPGLGWRSRERPPFIEPRQA